MKDVKYFIFSSQTVNLYRQFLKTLSGIPDKTLRNQLHANISAQFRKYSNIQDTSKMQYLLAIGQRELKNLQRLAESNSKS